MFDGEIYANILSLVPVSSVLRTWAGWQIDRVQDLDWKGGDGLGKVRDSKRNIKTDSATDSRVAASLQLLNR